MDKWVNEASPKALCLVIVALKPAFTYGHFSSAYITQSISPLTLGESVDARLLVML
jgi:hypothetical protein